MDLFARRFGSDNRREFRLSVPTFEEQIDQRIGKLFQQEIRIM